MLKEYLKLPSYSKHLGLIPILRRHINTLCGLKLRRTDIRKKRIFQTWCVRKLNSLLRSHKKILMPLQFMVRLLKKLVIKWWRKSKSEKIDLRQLVLFVDDLDRCQSRCIAKTLDAIRLVMTVPRVNVLICIDHRVAFKAVGEHYKKVVDEDGKKVEGIVVGRSAGEIARDYLGKIVQLPIRLQEPTIHAMKQTTSA